MRDIQIYRFMTPSPHSIGRDQPLSTAHEMMRKYRIRHLPVLDAGVLVGMVSQRDLHFIETLQDVDASEVLVEEAMSPDPYFVTPDTPLRKVAATMGEKKYGAAVVLDGTKVVGMFTVVDAMRALAELLGEREPVPRANARRSSRASSSPRPARPSKRAARPKKASG